LPANHCASLILQILVCFHQVEKEAVENYRLKHTPFGIWYAQNRQLITMTTLINLNLSVYLPSLHRLGIVESALANVICMRMYNRVEMRLLFAFGIFLFITATSLLIFLTRHVGFPRYYTRKTLDHWRKTFLKKLENKQLRAMRHAGLKAGSLYEVNEATPLESLLMVLDFSATVLLAVR